MRTTRFARLVPGTIACVVAGSWLATTPVHVRSEPAQGTGAGAILAAVDSTPTRSAPAPDARAASAAIEEARELIKSGDNDRAIEKLRSAVVLGRQDPAILRLAYLQLIKTYVFLGNDYRAKPQGYEQSRLNYREARQLIAEALAVPALRDLRAEPATDYPPEMIASFAEVRAQVFGAFRVTDLEPPGAVVLLDGQTLRAPAPGAPLGETDLPIGAHRVVVRHPGYQDVSEEVVVSPGATLERRYRLEKKRGAMWYASRGGVVAGVIGTVALLVGRNGGGAATATPLPGAPPPPSR